MSLKVLPPLFRYTNGSLLSVGTIRSRKPSLFMSPQMGLPHDFSASEIKPTWAVTSWNCWATDTDERAVTNPAMVARQKSAFLMPDKVPDKSRRPQSAALIKRQRVFIKRLHIWFHLEWMCHHWRSNERTNQPGPMCVETSCEVIHPF